MMIAFRKRLEAAFGPPFVGDPDWKTFDIKYALKAHIFLELNCHVTK